MATAAKTNGVRDAADDGADEIISKAEFARRMKRSGGWATQVTGKDGKFAEALTPDGKVNWSVAQVLDGVRADATKSPAPSSGAGVVQDPAVQQALASDQAFKDARARKMEADADASEAKRREQLGDLVSAKVIGPKLFGDLRDLRERILKVPDDVAEQVASMTDVREVRTVVMDALRDALGGYAEDLAARYSGDDHA